ncbi:hypothetical protein [Bradyrhizobium ottawaense]|uniref:hypothetical protein n=1 Tax=Bradyrhizobium ottawaense TaxID=931866 RepID=UPI0015CF6147|nr:hypothetical protein [Bradyrhizobium ottawaense]
MTKQDPLPRRADLRQTRRNFADAPAAIVSYLTLLLQSLRFRDALQLRRRREISASDDGQCLATGRRYREFSQLFCLGSFVAVSLCFSNALIRSFCRSKYAGYRHTRPRPSEVVIALLVSEVESKAVIFGGVTQSNLPQDLKNSRRSSSSGEDIAAPMIF